MLGQAVVSEACQRSIDVWGAARKGADLNLNITDNTALSDAFGSLRPEVVVNCASLINVSDCEKDPSAAWAVNGRAVSLMSDLCHSYGARLIQVSTDHYYTGDRNQRHDELASVSFLNEYARSKYAGEAFALSRPESLVARVNILGFRGWGSPTFIEWAIDMIMNNRKMTLFDDAYTSSIDVDNCARSLLDLIDKNAHGIYNLASSDVFSKKYLIEALANSLGQKLTKTKRGSVHSLLPSRAESLGLDVSKAEHKLGYALPTMAAVVASLVKKYETTIDI